MEGWIAGKIISTEWPYFTFYTSNIQLEIAKIAKKRKIASHGISGTLASGRLVRVVRMNEASLPNSKSNSRVYL